MVRDTIEEYRREAAKIAVLRSNDATQASDYLSGVANTLDRSIDDPHGTSMRMSQVFDELALLLGGDNPSKGGTLRDMESRYRRAAQVLAEFREDSVEEGREEVRKLINTPHTEDFIEAVKLEAEHQRLRWGSDHDAGKKDSDWFWLVAYLAGKAIHKPEKKLHHIVTTAAALMNWHAHATDSDTRMRPGTR